MPNFQSNLSGSTFVEREARKNAIQRKTNAYPGKCIKCTGYIAAHEGLLVRDGERWGVEHVECPTVEPEVKTAETVTHEVNTVNGQTIFDGTYTFDSVHGGHRTIRVRTQASDADFMPGAQIVGYLSGPDNTYDYTSVAHIKASRLSVWKKHRGTAIEDDLINFMADPSKAEVAKVCFRCHRLLTTPESLALGMGPECSGKGV